MNKLKGPWPFAGYLVGSNMETRTFGAVVFEPIVLEAECFSATAAGKVTARPSSGRREEGDSTLFQCGPRAPNVVGCRDLRTTL
jgi:hypothetical protein